MLIFVKYDDKLASNVLQFNTILIGEISIENYSHLPKTQYSEIKTQIQMYILINFIFFYFTHFTKRRISFYFLAS